MKTKFIGWCTASILLLTGCGMKNETTTSETQKENDVQDVKTVTSKKENQKNEAHSINIPDRRQAKRDYAATLTTIGDSISEGWLPHGYYESPYGQYTSDLLRMNFAQSACQGNAFVPTKKHKNNNFSDLIKYHEKNIKESSIIVIAEGTNDYGHNVKLQQVKAKMDENVKTIKEMNPDAYILGILPMDRWDKSKTKSAYDLANKAGYTLKELCDMEAKVYQDNKIAFTTFQDMGMTLTRDKTIDGLHPLPETQKEMGQALANHFAKIVMTQYEKPFDKMVTLKQKAPIWADLSFTSTKNILFPGTELRADKKYHHFNGMSYYSVYNEAGDWVGYVETNQVSVNGEENNDKKEKKKSSSKTDNKKATQDKKAKDIHP